MLFLFLIGSLKKHIEKSHGFKCTECGIPKFLNKYNYTRHMANIHGKTPLITFSCLLCKKQFKTREEYEIHNTETHSTAENEGGFKQIENALKGAVVNFRKIIRSGPALNVLLKDEYINPLLAFLEEERVKKGHFKCQLVVIYAYNTVGADDNDDLGTRQIPLR